MKPQNVMIFDEYFDLDWAKSVQNQHKHANIFASLYSWT